MFQNGEANEFSELSGQSMGDSRTALSPQSFTVDMCSNRDIGHQGFMTRSNMPCFLPFVLGGPLPSLSHGQWLHGDYAMEY